MGLILFILSVIVSIGLAVWFYLPNNVLGDGVVKFTDNAQTRAQTQAGNPEILVDTGLLYCINGYTVNNMANTVAHEIGHLFGLDHHPAPWHLLYGGERGHALFGAAPAEFDDMGFNIPNELPYWECL